MKLFAKQKPSFFLFSLFMGIILMNSCKKNEEQITNVEPKEIIFSLNAYSFNDLLTAKDSRDNEQVYSMCNLLDWCDSQGIKGLDPTGYFFPTYPEVPSDEYLANFKNKASELGIAVTGTGIRNNFASPDPNVRREGIELAKEWIVVASKLGAPVLRVFAGEIPEGYKDNWEEPAQWMIDSYKELLPYAEKYGVKIGIQNHGGMLQTAEQCLYVLKKVDSKWAGIIVDTGNFTTEDPYKDIEALVPYAVNWQLKEFTDGYGGSARTDYPRLIKIIKAGGYKGYVPIETLKVRNEPYDPFHRVQNMINKLNIAQQEVNSQQ